MKSNLTKQQKLEMVSKAIDAGFHVELRLQGVNSDAELDKTLAAFDESLVREFQWASSQQSETTWLWINNDNGYEDKFSATIFIDSLRGELE